MNELTNKIKKLKPSSGFIVATTKERDQALKEARDMKRFGIIDFEVTTRACDGGWKVFAL